MTFKWSKIFCCYRSKQGFWWFRIFGIGLHGKDITKQPPTFSERQGIDVGFKIGNWRIKWLRFMETPMVIQRRTIKIPEGEPTTIDAQWTKSKAEYWGNMSNDETKTNL